MNTNHSSALHPIAHGWVSSGSTGAQNYDEFASDTEITEVIQVLPSSMLAVEMPHRTPEAVRAGHGFADALPAAAAQLAALRSSGELRAVHQVVAPYRITKGEPGGIAEASALGVFCMVDTSQISSAVDEPGVVIRNEDVFIAKVRERVALTEKLGTLASQVLLLQTGEDASLHEFLTELIARLGEPAVSDVDQHGQRHEVWLLNDGPDQARLLELAGANELIVADGNHRTLAAQLGGLERFLAVVTTPQSVRIAAYHRLVRDLGTLSVAEVMAELERAGATITQVEAVTPPERPGTVLYGDGAAFHVNFSTPQPEGADIVEAMDHSCVERELFNRVLGLDAGDKRINYVGGDYPASWLIGEVDAGREALAVLLAPVSVAEFIDVNTRRLQMPRKSTWFTPKARAGLILADVEIKQPGGE